MSVQTELCGLERPGRRTLGLHVQNIGDMPEPNLAVCFEWDNEQPQPSTKESVTLGGGLMLHDMTLSNEPLAPSEKRTFYLSERHLTEEVLGRVAALSPERYRLTVRSGEEVLASVPGNLVAGVLEGLRL